MRWRCTPPTPNGALELLYDDRSSHNINRAFAVRYLPSKVGVPRTADRFPESQRRATNGAGACYVFVAKRNASAVRNRFPIQVLMEIESGHLELSRVSLPIPKDPHAGREFVPNNCAGIMCKSELVATDASKRPAAAGARWRFPMIGKWRGGFLHDGAGRCWCAGSTARRRTSASRSSA